jgi:hypothetical protein
MTTHKSRRTQVPSGDKTTRPESVAGRRKTSISLSGETWIWARQLCAKQGFGDNFSAYMANLVRLDHLRDEEREIKLRLMSRGDNKDTEN